MRLPCLAVNRDGFPLGYESLPGNARDAQSLTPMIEALEARCGDTGDRTAAATSAPFAATITGGYFGARVARRLPAIYVRWMVIAIGFGLSAYYFWQQSR